MGQVCCADANNAPHQKPAVKEVQKAKVQPSANQAEAEHRGSENDPGTVMLVSMLKEVPLLSKLKNKELSALAKMLVTEKFAPGKDLMTQGDTGNKFYILTSGTCEVLVELDGKVSKMAELTKGDYCGEQALLQELKRNATIRATKDVTCLVLDRTGFNAILQDSKVRFAKRTNKRIAIATENLSNFQIDMTRDTDKSEQVTQWILDSIYDNLLFENLSVHQQKVLVKHMFKENITKGTKLIEQGTEGKTFYVIEDGEFDIIVDDVGKVETLRKGDCTGELALMYNAPRSATVTAQTDGVVWVMERQTFRKALMDHNKAYTHQNIEFLKRVELLQPLLSSELALVDQALQEKTFQSGDVIFAQGDVGDNFYILLKGECEGTVKDGDQVKEQFKLTIGDFFGEIALMHDEPRAATIMAKQDDTICLWLPRDHFKELLGPLEDIMNRNIEELAKPAEQRDAQFLIGQQHHDEQDYCALDDYKKIGILGKGAFGTVHLVVDPNTDKSYALKAIRKCQVVELGQQSHIVNEKKVMGMLKSKFLVNLHNTYKDQWRVYFLLDVCLGGELFTLLRKMRSFDEKTARFFTGCVIEAFDYMHSLNVIYRDLKPENLVLDDTGYLKVTDFGFAKVVVNKTFTLCGTPDYLAPEIVTGQGHGKGVDWWTLGVLIYEMIASFPPFFDDEPMMTYRKIISCKFKFPKYLSPESKDIISRLLKVRPTKRLGVIKGGAKVLRDHLWFSTFSWGKLVDGSMAAPIKPNVTSPDDISNFEQFNPENEQLEFDSSKTDMEWDKEF